MAAALVEENKTMIIENWGWESVVSFNRGSCERGHAQFGHNRETHERVRRRWEETRQRELSFGELLEFLFQCHRAESLSVCWKMVASSGSRMAASPN
jgi:hypothetical protein